MDRNNKVSRFFRHLLSGPWRVRRLFSDAAMRNIETEIQHNETSHTGEIRFAVEAALHPLELMAGKTPRERAIELFAAMNVWDTEANNGVLIFLLLADHRIEVVADRGLTGKVGAEQWRGVCQQMEERLRAGEAEAAVIAGVEAVSGLLALHFPQDGSMRDEDELPNRPHVF